MQDLAAVREAFTDPKEFWSSPLYRRLSSVVAADPFLVGLAANARAGQGPTFAFFGAVHTLLLAGTEHPLADYYPSLRGESALPAPDAGPALTAFAHEHADEIRRLLQARLVQTNHVQRAVGLRLGLAAVAPQVDNTPVHLLEIGSSAGLVLRQHAYGYHLGGRSFGDRRSPVQLTTEWRSTAPVPDLDVVPVTASTTGIDLNPMNPADEDDRRWLEALVWPENRQQAELLRTAWTRRSTASGDADRRRGRSLPSMGGRSTCRPAAGRVPLRDTHARPGPTTPVVRRRDQRRRRRRPAVPHRDRRRRACDHRPERPHGPALPRRRTPGLGSTRMTTVDGSSASPEQGIEPAISLPLQDRAAGRRVRQSDSKRRFSRV